MKTTKKKGHKIQLSKCNPNRTKNNDNKFSCFNKKALIKIINSWNKKFDDKIEYKNEESAEVLCTLIDTKMNKLCNSEYCWSNQNFIKNLNDDDIKDTFRPKMPNSWYNSPREWLSTIDINNVLRQYQKANNDFLFIGAVPIDFDFKDKFDSCIVNELCNMSLKSLIKKGTFKVGIVFNLDPHDEPGSHWVALFINLYNNHIYYFDSYGIKPPKEVRILMNRLKKQGTELNRQIKLKFNDVRHQYKNSECGVYSINFLVSLLEGNDYSKHINEAVSDDDMNSKREYYFVKE